MLFTDFSFVLLVISILLIIFLLIYILKKKPFSQLQGLFCFAVICVLFITIGVLLQSICSTYFNITPIKFEPFIYIGSCFLPIAIFFIALAFTNTKITFKFKYLLLFIIPCITILMIFTNDFHHLFYINYSYNLYEMTFGKYFYIHTIYTYGLLLIGIFIMLKYVLKNSGFFSKQSLLIIIGTSIPIITNFLGTLKIINMNVFWTPISFSFAVFFYGIAIFKFKLLSVTPIALQKIVDRISDSYIVINEDNTITDFNETFLTTFDIKSSVVRNVNIFDLLDTYKEFSINQNILKDALEEVKNSSKTLYFEKDFVSIQKFFHIEINTITSKGNFLGILILLKDTTQHMQDMKTIKDNQDMLMEKERLASLGQLIGGIAHNLKTPIMSISGAAEGLNDLIREYDSSIGDSDVNEQDHHDIAHDMSEWVKKVKEYTEYMSDVITAVKGQAVVMSEQDSYLFTIDELVKRVDILMRHELKNALINLKTSVTIDGRVEIKGNVNSLVQVINNMISNAIQAYNGKTNENIEFTISKENSNIIISIKDYAGGLPKEVSDKLFKEMVTTKGKNGTGLGLFMSYSNIRAHFNGTIKVDSKPGVGTEFKVILPV